MNEMSKVDKIIDDLDVFLSEKIEIFTEGIGIILSFLPVLAMYFLFFEFSYLITSLFFTGHV